MIHRYVIISKEKMETRSEEKRRVNPSTITIDI